MKAELEKIKSLFPSAKVVKLVVFGGFHYQCKASVQVTKTTASGKQFKTLELIYANGATREEAVENFINKYL